MKHLSGSKNKFSFKKAISKNMVLSQCWTLMNQSLASSSPLPCPKMSHIWWHIHLWTKIWLLWHVNSASVCNTEIINRILLYQLQYFIPQALRHTRGIYDDLKFLKKSIIQFILDYFNEYIPDELPGYISK